MGKFLGQNSLPELLTQIKNYFYKKTEVDTKLAAKQDKLTTQTAYSAKGSATKVPQITTNNLGQVTGITEVTITQPTVNNGKLTIQANGSQKGTFTANQSGNTTVNITAADLGLDAALKYIGDGQPSAPTAGQYIHDKTTGAYVRITTSGTATEIAATKGDVFTYNKKEYVMTTAGKYATPNASTELGDEGSYALKTVTVTGTGALSGGGNLTANRTITHNTSGVGTAAASLDLYKIATDTYGHVTEAETVETADLFDILTDATTSTHGLMSAADKTKLNGIATGAEVNQNAFSNITVGSTTIAADSKTDTFTMVAGSNITLTPDATNDKVTITAKDTTYSNATTSAAGLMSAADKTKLDGLYFPVTITKSGSTYTSNKTYAQIQTAVETGYTPIATWTAPASSDRVGIYCGKTTLMGTSAHVFGFTIIKDITSREILSANVAITSSNNVIVDEIMFGEATTEVSGLMSAADKSKLNSAATTDDIDSLWLTIDDKEDSYNRITSGTLDEYSDETQYYPSAKITYDAIQANNKVFIATVNSTSAKDIYDAASAGKAVFAKEPGTVHRDVYVLNTYAQTGASTYTVVFAKVGSKTTSTNILTPDQVESYEVTGTTWTKSTTDISKIFVATYGTTSFDDISAAISANKLIVCFYNNLTYVCTNPMSGSSITLCALRSGYSAYTELSYISCSAFSGWSTLSNNYKLEDANNKTTVISSSSTNTQYPSAKATYDAIQANDKLFIATYGTTTAAEIYAAIQAGKVVGCKTSDGKLAMMTKQSGTNTFYFNYFNYNMNFISYYVNGSQWATQKVEKFVREIHATVSGNQVTLDDDTLATIYVGVMEGEQVLLRIAGGSAETSWFCNLAQVDRVWYDENTSKYSVYAHGCDENTGKIYYYKAENKSYNSKTLNIVEYDLNAGAPLYMHKIRVYFSDGNANVMAYLMLYSKSSTDFSTLQSFLTFVGGDGLPCTGYVLGKGASYIPYQLRFENFGDWEWCEMKVDVTDSTGNDYMFTTNVTHSSVYYTHTVEDMSTI